MMSTQFREKAMEALAYDPVSGRFTWRVDQGPKKAGDEAGCLRPDGYRVICVDYRNVRANRLAWLFMTGEFPPSGKEVDHRNRVRSDDRWQNLRLATRRQNGSNVGVRSNSTSGVRGVYRNARCKTWDASIRVNRKRIFLGQFEDIAGAAAARKAAEREYYGDFA